VLDPQQQNLEGAWCKPQVKGKTAQGEERGKQGLKKKELDEKAEDNT